MNSVYINGDTSNPGRGIFDAITQLPGKASCIVDENAFMKNCSFTWLLFLILICPESTAQKFVAKIGLGLGGKFETRFPACTSNKGNKGRIMATISQFYLPSETYHIGLQAITSGRLFSIIGGAAGTCESYDATTNTRTLNYNNLNAASFLLRNRLLFGKGRKLNYYGDIGLGVTTYSYGSITADKGTVRKTSFAISPGVGLYFNRFEVSCLAILGGKTPNYTGYDSFSANNVSLSSISSQQLYVTLQYSLLRF